jgi:conjugative transfer signal peptidase TraF
MKFRLISPSQRWRRACHSPGAILTFGALGLGFIGFSVFTNPVPALVWNASASAPIGLYRVMPGAVTRGDLVLVRPPETVARLAAERGYLPAGVPLIKRISAVEGDHVCVVDGFVAINGEVVGRQLWADGMGRLLPHWQGCEAIEPGALFLLLEDAEASFDSRYFGPVPNANVIGKLAPLWTR